MSVFTDAIKNGLERYGKYYGTYAGIVYRVYDPTGRGRISVSVPMVSKTVLKSPALPKGQWQGPGYGFYMLPKIGDSVLVEFINGEISQPVWSFGPWVPVENAKGEPNTPYQTEVVRFKTPSGYEIVINEHPSEVSSENVSYIQLTTPKGNMIKLDDERSLFNFDFGDNNRETAISIDGDFISGSLSVITKYKDTELDFTMNAYGKNIYLKGANGDSIQLDGDGNCIINGGDDDAVAITALTERLNKLQGELINLINDYKQHMHPTAGTGSPSPPQVPYTGTISKFSNDEYNDSTVKHPKH